MKRTWRLERRREGLTKNTTIVVPHLRLNSSRNSTIGRIVSDKADMRSQGERV